MNELILKHFKLLNKLFGNYRWFQVILKGVLDDRFRENGWFNESNDRTNLQVAKRERYIAVKIEFDFNICKAQSKDTRDIGGLNEYLRKN